MNATTAAKLGQDRINAAVELATEIALGMMRRGVDAKTAQNMAANFASLVATGQLASAAATLAA